MVELKDELLLINGKPQLIFCGEIHYFRLQRKDWEDRILKLKNLGCNTVASYVPWIVHEPLENDIDLTGHSKPENDLGAFIDLCHHHGLWFIPRPGPFIMAEMKNEGIPYWVYEKYPDVRPISFHNQAATSSTVDYLHAGFLKESAHWYQHVMPIFAKRLIQKGGPIIALQLDNEVGMLSWVTNQPDLSENALCGFAEFLGKLYGASELAARYPLDLNDVAKRQAGFRELKDDYALAFHRDFTLWTREKIDRYFRHLRAEAEGQGIGGIPFVVNIHGSGGGRGVGFPVGIHHLMQAYNAAPGYLPGSDHYLGEITRDNVADLYLINAWMKATNPPGVPLAAMEFEVGSGDYGDNGAMRYSGSAADFKVRLSVAQGCKAFNYYLLAGGRNPVMPNKVNDGNERIAITGERHGFAAPINPEGHLDATYQSLMQTTQAMNEEAAFLAGARQVMDDIAVGFMADYYAIDYSYPGPIEALKDSLEGSQWPLNTLVRALLNAPVSFSVQDLSRGEVSGWPRALAISSAKYMAADIQRRLVEYMHGGGRLLVYGDFPVMDLEGKPCLELASALGVKLGKELKEIPHAYYPTVAKPLHLSESADIRVWRMTTFESLGAGSEVLLETVDGLVAGFEVAVGAGKAIVIGCEYTMHRPLFAQILDRLGVKRHLSHDYEGGGVVVTSLISAQGQMLSVINLDSEAKRFTIRMAGRPVVPNLSIPGKSGKLIRLV